MFLAGSGFVSNDLYLHGFFSASIKLPSDYSAGVVVAFYVSKNNYNDLVSHNMINFTIDFGDYRLSKLYKFFFFFTEL